MKSILPKVLDGRGQALAPYVPGFPEGALTGPMLLSLGHGHPDAYAFGPAIPGEDKYPTIITLTLTTPNSASNHPTLLLTTLLCF